MNFLHYMCLDAWDACLGLRRKPLRSLLSSFGIGIGVAALVAMLSISEGAKQKALAKIISLGVNTIRIENSTERVAVQDHRALNLSQGLVIEDVERLQVWSGQRALIGSYVREDNVTIAAGSRSATATVLAVTDTWYEVEKLELAWGRHHNEFDEQQGSKVCVVGSGVRKSFICNQMICLCGIMLRLL